LKGEESLVELDGTSIYKKALPIATILPQLEVIRLEGSYELQTDFLRALPPTLRELRLKTATGLWPSDLERMPVHLETLSLGAIPSDFYRKVIIFPLHLKTFIAESGRWVDAQIEMLPPGLTVLNLGYSALTDLAVALLPRSLLELRVPTSSWSDEALQALPPKLLILDLSRNNCLTSSCFLSLPH
jgi:hypothetical protein